MDIYLIRHTRVALSRDFCYGISDIDLADSHKEDINLVRAKLDGIQVQKSYTSPLRRCKALAGQLSNGYIEEKALVEMNFGDWELQKWEDLDQQELDKWMNDFVNISPPSGECYLDFSTKGVFFFDRLVSESNDHETILLTTHSGVIRAIICHILNLSLAHSFNFEIDYGSVTKIEVIDKWYKIKYLNL